MLQKLKEKHEELKTVFRKYENIACAYVFGSAVKSFLMPESDIDFAILTEDGSFDQKAILAYELEKSLGFIFPVDLVVLNIQKLIFQHTVIKEGKIVYEQDRNKRVQFEVNVMKDYCELEPHLRFMEKYRLRGLLRRVNHETT